MQNRKNLLGGLFAIVVLFLLCYHFWTAVIIDNIKYVKIAGQNIKVDLALTKEEQAQGLSARGVLADNEGMLFVFNQPGKYPFWMKEMNFAIDIIWLGEDMRVIYIKNNALPELYPETYGPNDNAKYVLEVVSGFSEKNNLKVGDRVEFTR